MTTLGVSAGWDKDADLTFFLLPEGCLERRVQPVLARHAEQESAPGSTSIAKEEERSWNRGSWAQVLPMRGMSVAALSTAADGSLFLASGSDGGIRRLAPIPFREQAETLADATSLQKR